MGWYVALQEDEVLVLIPHVGLIWYKQDVPVKFYSDELYAKPRAKFWAKVKTEKIDRSFG